MKKIKETKGITLVALIITIIVLLILAVVAISAVQGDGIIAHAKNARDDYQAVQDEENTVLGNYLEMIKKANLEDNGNTKTSFPIANYKSLYKRDGSTYYWIFINENNTIKAYALDYDGSNWYKDQDDIVVKITYDEFITKLGQMECEHEINIENIDNDIFYYTRTTSDKGICITEDFYIFNNNYTNMYKYRYEDEDGEKSFGLFDEDKYVINKEENINIDEILAK